MENLGVDYDKIMRYALLYQEEVDSSKLPQRNWEPTNPLSNVHAKYEPDTVSRDLHENVDKESIGDLTARKKQWEKYMIEQQAEIERQKALLKQNKSTVRHWEVKPPVLKDKMATTESAIEREMRITLEREAELKREKERIQNESPSVEVHYHEMTEADRGSQMPRHENIIEREIRELKQREAELRRQSQIKYVGSNSNRDPNTGEFLGTEAERIKHEGYFDAEIKNLHNREQELTRERAKLESSQESASVQQSAPVPNGTHKTSKYEIQPFEQRHSENLIMREMRELREREDELRKLRKSMGQLNTTDATDSGVASQSIIYGNSNEVVSGSYSRDVGPYKTSAPVRRMSGDSQNSKSSGTTNSSRCTDSTTPSKITVAPMDNGDDTPSKLRYQQETAVEREKRLAYERELEHKRLCGQPIREPPKQVRMEVRKTSITNSNMPRSQSTGDTALKHFASSQLQSEIERDRRREMDLKREGKIQTISQERIGEPVNYIEHVSSKQSPVNNLDGKKTRSPSLNSFPSSSSSASDELVNNRAASPASQIQGINVQPPMKKKVHNPTEGKIEKELREMKDREAELSRQRKRLSYQDPGPKS